MDTSTNHEWIEAADLKDFEKTDRLELCFDENNPIGIFRLDEGEFIAISIWCSHEHTSMMRGEVEDGVITCPIHGARFDLQSGRNLSLPAVRPVPSFEVRVEGDKLLLKIPRRSL